MVARKKAFAPIKKQKAVEQVAEALRNAILDGSIQPGDLLPSERRLAEDVGGLSDRDAALASRAGASARPGC